MKARPATIMILNAARGLTNQLFSRPRRRAMRRNAWFLRTAREAPLGEAL